MIRIVKNHPQNKHFTFWSCFDWPTATRLDGCCFFLSNTVQYSDELFSRSFGCRSWIFSTVFFHVNMQSSLTVYIWRYCVLESRFFNLLPDLQSRVAMYYCSNSARAWLWMDFSHAARQGSAVPTATAQGLLTADRHTAKVFMMISWKKESHPSDVCKSH